MSLFSTQKIQNFHKKELPKDQAPLPVEIIQHQEKLIILAPIAGVTMEDIHVSLTDDTLNIKGERTRPDDLMDDVNTLSSECHWGAFSRSIVLPLKVDTEKVAAFYKDGILRIEMPIAEDSGTRVIPIQH